MSKLRVGIICPSEIAYRRFMPALMESSAYEYVGVAIANDQEWDNATENQLEQELQKAKKFQEEFGGAIFNSYSSLLQSDGIDVVYLPLPPALHYKWAVEAFHNGKHVFIEKPSTTSAAHTKELVAMAKAKGLALHENYMFVYHSQLDEIDKRIRNGEIGEVRLYRIAFGFPKRSSNDFRYNLSLGGGALLDCGGYTLRLAMKLLGSDAHLTTAQMNYEEGYEVDMFGSGTLVNSNGVTAQLSFGMDNDYKCELEVWGSKGCLRTNRILTAPKGYKPEISLKKGNDTETISLEADDTFKKSLDHMEKCITEEEIRNKTYEDLIKQSELVEQFQNLSC